MSVAVISRDREMRGVLARYLASAGFDVHECDELARPDSFTALVLLGDAIDRVRSWMELANAPRVVVVTSRPSALKDLRADHEERLSVLAAPAFGWEVVDALRGNPKDDPAA